MKAKQNQVSRILHLHLNNGDVSAMLRRTLISVALGLWLACVLGALLAWGLK